MDVGGGSLVLGFIFCGPDRDISRLGRGRRFCGDARPGNESGADGGWQRLFLPDRVPAKFWVGAALCSSGVALLSWSGGEKKKGGLASDVVGLDGGSQFFPDRCHGRQGGSPYRVGTVRSPDDVRVGGSFGICASGLGLGGVGGARVGSRMADLRSILGWISGGGRIGGDRDQWESDRGECGVRLAGAVVRGPGLLVGKMGGKPGSRLARENLGDARLGGGIVVWGRLGGLGLIAERE